MNEEWYSKQPPEYRIDRLEREVELLKKLVYNHQEQKELYSPKEDKKEAFKPTIGKYSALGSYGLLVENFMNIAKICCESQIYINKAKEKLKRYEEEKENNHE